MGLEQKMLIALLSMILSVVIVLVSSAFYSAEIARAEQQKAEITETQE